MSPVERACSFPVGGFVRNDDSMTNSAVVILASQGATQGGKHRLRSCDVKGSCY
jgi:hypothetical protein